MVGIPDRIVIGIINFSPRACLQFTAAAHWFECLESSRIAFVVFRAVAAHLVQYDQHIMTLVFEQEFIQTIEHADIPTFRITERIMI